MKLNLQDIPRVQTITKGEFIKHYFKPQKPVVIEHSIDHWPAYTKWNLEYIKTIAGNKTIPLYDNRPANYKTKFNTPHATMKMSEYIDLLQREPTKYRIFLWNIFKKVPALQKDFSYPNLGLRFMKKLPMLFFGGQNSYTFMHYDIDLANIFHFHFEGKKECILFDQKQGSFLYKVPFSLLTRHEIDFINPDFEKWPALKRAKGYKTHLNHGEVLYMPEGYWHLMRYITPGFSMSLRAIPQHPKNFIRAVYNVFIMRRFENVMRKIYGQKWLDRKNKQAIIRTHKKNGIPL